MHRIALSSWHPDKQGPQRTRGLGLLLNREPLLPNIILFSSQFALPDLELYIFPI